uniref:Putative secreted protein n=1 Tax=Ixodes ricinus TaxID=34613 RepID=A0A6B0TX86_IXORI
MVFQSSGRHSASLYLFLLLGRSCRLQCCIAVVVRGAAARGLWALPPPPEAGAASPSPSMALSSRICLMR